MATPILIDQEALLAAVIAAPEDDVPRLVYADWLEDHGDPTQAEYIRAAVEMERWPPDDPRRERRREWLEERAKEHRKAWFAALGLTGRGGWVWHRGFVERLHFHGPKGFFETASDWFRLMPVWHLDHPLLTGRPPGRRGPAPARRHAGAGAGRGPVPVGPAAASVEGWEALFRSPHLTKGRTLSVPSCGLAEDVVTSQAASPSLAGLTALDLWNNPIGVAGAEAILNSPRVKRLRVVQIVECFYGDEEGEDEVLAELGERFGDGLRDEHDNRIEEFD